MSPLDAPPPLQVRVWQGEPNPTGEPTQLHGTSVLTVTRQALSSLQFVRAAEVHFRPDRPTIKLHIVLPRTHPSFVALAQGYISPAEFISANFGNVSHLQEVVLTHSLTTNADVGVVDLEGHWPWPIAEFEMSMLNLGYQATNDILWSQDTITFHFDGVAPAWFDNPMPKELTKNAAIWHDPFSSESSTFKARVGLVLPDGVIAYRASIRESEVKVERQQDVNLREFLANIEERTGSGFTNRTWRTLTLLIPYISLFWLARHRPFGSKTVWTSLTAMALTLAVWRCWDYFLFLGNTGPAAWLYRYVNTLRYTVGLEGTEVQQQQLFGVGENAFWLIFVPCVALIPMYIREVERRLEVERQLESPSTLQFDRDSFLRRREHIARIVFGALAFVLLYLVIQLDVRNPPIRQFEQLITRVLPDETYRGNIIPAFMLGMDQRAQVCVEIVALIVFLLAFSWRAALFGLGLFAVIIRAIAGNDEQVLFRLQDHPLGAIFSILEKTREIPWLVVLVLVSATAYPLVVRQIQILLPRKLNENFQRPQWPKLLGLTLIILAVTFLYLPPRLLMLLSRCLIVAAIGWLGIFGLRELEPIKPIATWLVRWPLLFFAGLAAIAVLLTWPLEDPSRTLQFRDLFYLMLELDNLFFYIVAFGIVLLMREVALSHPKDYGFLPSSMLTVAVLFFALFVVNSSTLWLFLPVPLLMGLWVARFGLFRRATEVQQLQPTLIANASSRQLLIRQIIDEAPAQVQFEHVKKSLTKKLQAAELTVQEYKDKIDEYKQYFQEQLVPNQTMSQSASRNTVFASGERDTWTNTLAVVKYGVILATIPLVIALYQYLPNGRVNYPYPIANLLSFFVRSITTWLMYAFFFGYYYVYFHGNYGITKGFVLSLGIIFPFAAYRFLSTQSGPELLSFALWAAQVLLFCILLGLLAMDHRLLRKYGFFTRDLLSVYNAAALSIFGSSIIVAITPAIVAFLTGQLGQSAKFFLETVIQRGFPGGE